METSQTVDLVSDNDNKKAFLHALTQVKWRPDALANDLMQEKNMSSLGHSECMCFAAQFSKSPGSSRYILAGGSQNNEAKVFDTQNGSEWFTGAE